MNTTTDGGPAFPVSDSPGYNFDTRSEMNGISVRDYFAAKAMAALIQRDGDDTAYGSDLVVGRPVLSYEYADAMIKARSQT